MTKSAIIRYVNANACTLHPWLSCMVLYFITLMLPFLILGTGLDIFFIHDER